jgi:hypothetical protein
MLVGPPGRYLKTRVYQHGPHFRHGGDRAEAITDAFSQRRTSQKEEGHVRPESDRQTVEGVIPEARAQELVHPFQRRRRVAAPTAQAGAHGNPLVQLEPHTSIASAFTEKQVGGTVDKISLIRRQVAIWTNQLNPARGRLHAHYVKQPHGHHEGHNVVVTV